MFKRSSKPIVILTIVAGLILVCWQVLGVQPIRSEMLKQSEPQPSLIATAPTPPSLVPAILGGKPVYVLYVTRAEDTVLVRCYPGYQPTITVRTMGSNPAADLPKEGVLTCKLPA